MFLGMYALEPGFRPASYDHPLTIFLVPGDGNIFTDACVESIADMLRKRDVEVCAEHDFSCEAVYDEETKPDMHLLVFPPPGPLEICCRLFWRNSRTFLWYAFGSKPVEIPMSVLNTWLKDGKMAFVVGPISQPSE